MHYDYVVALKRSSSRKTDFLSFVLLILSAIAFLFIQSGYGFRPLLSAISIAILTGLGYNLYALSRKKEIRFRIWLFVAAVGWICMPVLQWLFIPFFILGFLEIQAKYPLEIAFHNDGVVLNNLFKKKISWDSLQSVILKDGILTLDYKDNRLFQKEVIDDDEPDADEDEFNLYCRGKIVNLP